MNFVIFKNFVLLLILKGFFYSFTEFIRVKCYLNLFMQKDTQCKRNMKFTVSECFNII